MEESRYHRTQNKDGSWNVTAELVLYPGLLGRYANSTHPPLPSEKEQRFTCDVTHDDLTITEQAKKNVTVQLLCKLIIICT